MASSLGSTRDGTPFSTTNKHIPLLCTVCPEAPRFSDVSHLLTHIASKGHLHHETQTKLKAHQDIAASVTLQQYEHWYKDNGIESLLVERMRAKQQKEVVKNKRSNGSTPLLSKKFKRKPKRAARKTTVKAEQEELPPEYPIFPGFFTSDNEAELEEESTNGDMLSLKGQVWPGMGKMDLANEDMKRTRNQRKPKSVIDKMKRASEGIEPTQVVMTPDLEVERIKGVYDDSSSPIPGQEDESPKKAPRPKKKRSEALRELSVNVPRRAVKRSGRQSATVKKPALGEIENDVVTPTISASTSFRHGHDVFRDDDCVYDERLFTAPASRQDQRFDIRSRFGMHLYRVPTSSNVSPTRASKDGPTHSMPMRNTGRLRSHTGMCDSYSGHGDFSSVNHSDAAFGVNDASVYNYSSRLPFMQLGNLGSTNDMFRFGSSHQYLQPKQEPHPSAVQRDSINGVSSHQYLHISESNPLFAQNRSVFGAYHPAGHAQTMPSYSLEAQGQMSEHNHPPAEDKEGYTSTSCNIKIEARFNDMVDDSVTAECRQPSFSENEVWGSAEQLDL